MLIISNNERKMCDSTKYREFSAGDKSVLAMPANGETKADILASYDNAEQCKFALGLLRAAMIADDKYFDFPHRDDLNEMMNQARQHKSKYTSRKVSYGGS